MIRQLYRKGLLQASYTLGRMSRASASLMSRDWSGSRRRGTAVAGAALLLFAETLTILSPLMTRMTYVLGPAEGLLTPVSQSVASHIQYDAKAGSYVFAGATTSNQDLLSMAAASASTTAYQDARRGLAVSDPASKTTFTLTPKFGLAAGQLDGNRVVYPINGVSGWLVDTMHVIGTKEDIILTGSSVDGATFDYTLGLGDGLAARLEKDGSIGIYGNSLLSGDITTGSDKDAALLKKARASAPKTTLLYHLPAPVIKTLNKKKTAVSAKYALNGTTLRVVVSGLKNAAYPLTIDPSIYVSSAQQFMNGNNETNVDFDVTDALIQKGQTTGARFDSWNSTQSLNAALWQQGTVAAGGFIYTVGGKYPNGDTTVVSTQGSASYTVPSNASTITVKIWGGGGGGGGAGSSVPGQAGGGGGFIQANLSVTPNETLNLYVGGGGAAGSAASSSGEGGGGGGYSSVYRGSTPLAIAAGGGGGGGGGNGKNAFAGAGGAGGGTSGVAGGNATSTTNGGGGGTQSGGGTGGTDSNPGQAGSSLKGGGGADGYFGTTTGDGPAGGSLGGGNGGSVITNGRPAGGGGGGGYFGGGGGGGGTSRVSGGGGGGGSSYTDAGATSVTNAAGSGTTPGGSTDPYRNSAGTGGAAAGAGTNGLIVILASAGTGGTNNVSWAQFSQTDGSITSANPGSGTCSGWCSTTAYSLPSPRNALSLVAYNGFLYAIGGEDSSCTSANGTGDNGICKTVYVAKLGANGEPRLWHPTDTNQANWVYWYRTGDLPSPRSQAGVVAYNNRMYLLGGKTSVSGVTSIVSSSQIADIIPTGTLGSWATSSASLPVSLYGHGIQVYNDRLYIIGGSSSIGGSVLSSVYYDKINTDGTLNNWVQTKSLSTGRMSNGGNFTAVWGGYIYVSGGCTAQNASGYCTSIASDTAQASINTDGTIDSWISDAGVSDTRMGHNILTWRNYIYEIGGCSNQTTAGACTSGLSTINYGAINQAGDISTVSQSAASGTSPCSGGTPYNCDLPPAGNNAGQIGQMLNATAIVNGFLYVAGGCNTASCSGVSNNTAYTMLGSGGSLTAPTNCTSDGNTLVGSWCVDSTHTLNPGNGGTGHVGVAAAATAVFNNTIYFAGGFNGSGLTSQIYYVTINSDGSLSGSGWTYQDMTLAGATATAYSYAYARANPAAASTAPGSLFIFGGCSAVSGASCTTYTGAVYKCDIQTSGAIANCSTTGQLQIGTVSGASGAGLAGMGGTVYANYVYLIGGAAPGVSGLATVYYAKIDNSNNIVAVSGSSWTLSPSSIPVSSSYASAFGYNGYLYVAGGYNSTNGVLGSVEFAKVNVSDGSIGTFSTSGSTMSGRWGMGLPVSGSYVYLVGGCGAGAPPSSCSSLQPQVQTFQVYNNSSGAPAGYTTAANTYSTSPNRIGAAAAVLNGYIYTAGGCTSATDCTTAVSDVSYAPLNADGSVGSWASTTAALPAVRAWGKLEAAGGSLYYLGGQSSTASDIRSEVYYATPSSGNISTWSTASNGLPGARTKFGAAVWNNRLYVVGGLDGSAAPSSAVYVSPQLISGGNITSAWSTSSTTFNVPRSSLTAIAYANNLYVFGGYTGSAYLSDGQYAQIDTTTGTVGSWSYTTSLPTSLAGADGFAVNGYLYVIGGTTNGTSCPPATYVAPISANTTIASGNHPTGVGSWYETAQNYTGNRYGAAAVYNDGKAYVLGGGCGSTLTYASPVTQQTSLLSQPQVAKYSVMFDTDSDVTPNDWLVNGLDNSIGAQWQLRYRSMTNTTTSCTSPAMTTWGQETNFGNITLGTPSLYTPRDGSGNNTNCARFFYMNLTVDSSKAFGYPDDVSRGPTITDLTLEFTADPSKRLMHGRTFTGGLQQPDDTPYYSN